MGVLKVSMFGCPRVAHDNFHWFKQKTRPAQILLGYLVLHGHRLHPRDVVATTLWGEASEQHARGALRTTLWRLRSSLEPTGVARGSYIVSTSAGEIGLNWDSDLWCDVCEFESSVQEAMLRVRNGIGKAVSNLLRTSVDLYTGELLEGFYDDWIIRERERLRSLYLKTLVASMRHADACGDQECALSFGERIIAEDPLRESIYREVILFHLKLGQRVQALRTYERCEQVLKEELDVEPMQETQALFQQIISGSLPPSSSLTTINDVDLETALRTVSDAMVKLQEASELLSHTIDVHR